MISGTFHHHEEIFEVNANEDIENMDICDFTQDTSPTLAPLKDLPVTSTILTTPLEVHSYTPLSSKQKQPPNDESNSKTIAPKSTNLTQTTSQPSATKLSTATLKRKAPPPPPSKSENPQTNYKIIFTTSVTFSYTTHTPTIISTNTHAFIHCPHHIPQNNSGATAHHSTKAKKDDYTRHLLKTQHIITYSLYIFCCIYFDSTKNLLF